METGGERKGQPWAKGGDVPGGLGGGGWLPLCCLGPCLLPAGQETGRGAQDMSQRHQNVCPVGPSRAELE